MAGHNANKSVCMDDLRLCKEGCDATRILSEVVKQNEELQNEIDVLKKAKKSLEEIEQERYALQLRLDQKEAQETWYGEEISVLKQQLADGEEKLRTDLEAKHSHELSRINQRVKELESDLEVATSHEAQLGSKVEELERLLQDRMNQSELMSRSYIQSPSDESEMLRDQLNSMIDEVTSLKSQLIDKKAEVQSVTSENTVLTERLSSLTEELQEVERQHLWATNALEEAKVEKSELECLLESQKMHSESHNQKGNSIFSELDDRRVDAESRLNSLRDSNKAMKEKYTVEKQQNLEYKRQISRLQVQLQLNSGRVDSEYVREIEGKLLQAREEVRALLKEKNQQEEEEKSHTKTMANLKSDGDYQKYLVALLTSKQEVIDRLKDEMSFKSILLLDEKDRVMSLRRQINDLEREQNKANCQNIKLSMKLEELRLKYEPDAVKKSDMPVVKRVEKIPLDNAEVVISEKKLNQSETSLHHVGKKAAQPLVETTSDNVAKRLTDKSSKKPMTVTECLNLKKKTVSLSDDVTEFEIENSVESTESRSQLKGRRITTVKHVSKDSCKRNFDANECKTQ